MRIEPTFTPHPGDERARTAELPLGEPGHYVNVTFGYRVQYPPDWYTGFGNRPLLVSFSDLDPGTHNRSSMRAEGCLIEINAATNIYGFTFEGLMGQMPRSFPDAERFELDGQAALRVRPGSGENPFESERVYVEHDNWCFDSVPETTSTERCTTGLRASPVRRKERGGWRFTSCDSLAVLRAI